MHEDLLAARQMAWECLERWVPFSEKHLYTPPDRPDLLCYGSGYINWGVQTNQKYVGTMATLAGWRCRANNAAVEQDPAYERALLTLRHNLASHHTGDYHCTDGTKWGRTWISGLGIERMMHGLEWIEPHLPEPERQGLARLLADEADYHLTAPVVAGLWASDKCNKPESNIWNGAICVRAAMLNPDHPHVADWIAKAHDYLLNGISIPADAEDDRIVAGRPLREWHRGANFFPNYALDHHGYLNVGYMVICLSNIAMLHYSCRLRGIEPPATLYHHATDLWNVVRKLIFADGRLARIGGDTRIRYCYCQDYLLPTLVLAADLWADANAPRLLRRAVELIRREQDANDDGGFVSGRLGNIARENPYYYTRLESDRAVVLSMVLAWLAQLPIETARTYDESSAAGSWIEPEHGAVAHRCPTRLASWSWRAAEPPQGLCLPPDRGDLAEWAENLAGAVTPIGHNHKRRLDRYMVRSFEGGFVTAGTMLDGADVQLLETWKAEFTAKHHLVFAALPDGHTTVRIEVVDLPARRVYLTSWMGVKLQVPNDLYNKHVRRYATAAGVQEMRSHFGEPQVVDLASQWVNIDDAIGLIGLCGANSWHLVRSGRRTGGYAYGNILVDTLCYGLATELSDVTGPAKILDNACLMVSSVDAAGTARMHAERRGRAVACRDAETHQPAEAVRAVQVAALDGKEYLLVANFAEQASRVALADTEGCWVDLVTNEALDGASSFAIEAGEARVAVRRG